MSLLEEKTQSPSLALISTFVAVITAFAFGGVYAFYHASSSTITHQAAPVSAPVEGNI